MINSSFHLFPLPLLLFTLSSSFQGFAQPRLLLPRGNRIDLGTLYESNETHYGITVRNGGTDTLHIRKVTASCGCTATQIRDASVAPGDTSSIDVKFLNADINGPSIRHVYIVSDDTTAGSADVTFIATVLPVLKADPRYLSFGTVRLHATVTRTLRLENTVDDTLRILSAHAQDPRIRVTLERKTLPPHTSVVVRTDCVASSAVKLLGEISFATDSKLKPVVKVSYVGKISRD